MEFISKVQANGKAYVKFERERKPENIEADAHMNIGVALMPFMKGSYHFIKEENSSI